MAYGTISVKRNVKMGVFLNSGVYRVTGHVCHGLTVQNGSHRRRNAWAHIIRSHYAADDTDTVKVQRL